MKTFRNGLDGHRGRVKEAVTLALLLAAASAVLVVPAGAGAGPDRREGASEAADRWLLLVDEGRYPESWKEASAYFQGAVSEALWTQTMSGQRKPLGKVLSRKRVSAVFYTSLPGAPDGEYVVIQYETSFEHKQSAVETVTPMREPDGSWRVSGYYVR